MLIGTATWWALTKCSFIFAFVCTSIPHIVHVSVCTDSFLWWFFMCSIRPQFWANLFPGQWGHSNIFSPVCTLWCLEMYTRSVRRSGAYRFALHSDLNRSAECFVAAGIVASERPNIIMGHGVHLQWPFVMKCHSASGNIWIIWTLTGSDHLSTHCVHKRSRFCLWA